MRPHPTAKSHGRRRRSLLAVVGVALLFGGCFSSLSKKHPTDDELLKNFQTHKVEFDRLLKMFLADKELGRVAPDFTRPEDPRTVGVSPERLGEYRKLLNTLGLSNGIEGYKEKDLVYFHSSAQGLAVSGSGKGYAFAVIRPALVVDNLDNYWSKDSRSFTAFRHIEGNWYLYFDYED